MTHEIWKSAFIAAFFALHPLHVESVAWISERKDVLSAIFRMLTLCCYVYYTEKPIIKRYLLVLFSFVLALMSKPMVITLPVIMMLLDYWPLNRFQAQKSNGFLWQVKEKSPLFILSAVFIVITFIAQYKPYEPDASFPLVSRLVNAPVTFVTYLFKTFWPYDLAAIYPFSYQIPVWQVTGALSFIIFITSIIIIMRKRIPFCFVGWFWYTITIAPVIGIIQVGNQAMADRYTYLPLIGISIGLAWKGTFLFSSQNTRKKILFPASIVFLAFLTFLTWEQSGYWRNSKKICNHLLRVTKNNYVAHINLGSVLFDEGKNKEAIAHYNEVIRIKPNLILSYNKRGLAYARLGQYQKAFADLNKVILQKPDYADAYHSRAVIYYELGQYPKALEDFNKAIHLKPDYAEAYNNRANMYLKLGQPQKAIDDMNKAVSLKPDAASLYFNRGNFFINISRYQQATKDYTKAISLNPAYPEAYNNRAFAYLNLGQYQQALEDYSKAIMLKPNYADAYNNRAFVYLTMGNIDAGCLDAKKACDMRACSTLQLVTSKGLCR
jgi:Flp pilus assembly protein TadD